MQQIWDIGLPPSNYKRKNLILYHVSLTLFHGNNRPYRSIFLPFNISQKLRFRLIPQWSSFFGPSEHAPATHAIKQGSYVRRFFQTISWTGVLFCCSDKLFQSLVILLCRCGHSPTSIKIVSFWVPFHYWNIRKIT